jgi:hypothetical protein
MKGCVLASVLGALLVMTGCELQRAVTPLGLVPGDAVAAVEFRWREARAEPALREMAELPPSFAHITDLDLPIDAVQSVVVFTRALSATASQTVIMKADGLGSRFTAVADAARWQIVPVSGTNVYLAPGHRNAAAIAIGDDILVAGSRESIDTFANEPRTMGAFIAKTEFADVRELMADSSPIGFAVAWPADVAGRSRVAVEMSAGLLTLAGYGAVGSIVEQLGIGRAYVVRLRPEAGGVRYTVAGVMQDEDTAATVSGGLSLLKGLAGMVPAYARQGPPDPTSTLTIERTGAVVRVGMLILENK